MKAKFSLTLTIAITLFSLSIFITNACADLTLAEKIQLEADYILACQYINPGDAAHGAINDVHGYPTWIVPRENGMAILGLFLANEILPQHDPSYIDRANLSMDFLVSIQEEDGAWCDHYIRRVEDGQVIAVVLSKSPTHAAEVMMAMYKLGYREERYNSMKLAAQYLFACRDNGYQGLIVGGKKSDGSFNDWNWITDNSYAYWALLAARGWALVNGETTFAQECEDAAGLILNGINNYFRRYPFGPDWWTIVDQYGGQFYFDFDVYGRISWMNFAPQFLDLPATGVGNTELGEWIHTTFQVPSGNDGCIWGDAFPNREYPGISFQSSFCWFDLGQDDYANAAISWAENSGLWQTTAPLPECNGTAGGWIDWITISEPIETESCWMRFIDTSFYSIASWLGGYDFTVFDNNPPILSYIGNKSVLVGSLLTFEIFGSDPDVGDTITYKATNLPQDATFDEDTHIFSWQPSSTGIYVARFEVNDGYLIDFEDVAITVYSQPGPCFLAGTPILLADGSQKPIEQIKVGDIILAYDVDKNKMVKDKVKAVSEHDSDHYLIVNNELKVTPNHPVYSEEKWVEIGNLKIGDKILKQDGKYQEIKSIRKIDSNQKVYNFEVNPYHTYVANGYVVHNRKIIHPCKEAEPNYP